MTDRSVWAVSGQYEVRREVPAVAPNLAWALGRPAEAHVVIYVCEDRMTEQYGNAGRRVCGPTRHRLSQRREPLPGQPPLRPVPPRPEA